MATPKTLAKLAATNPSLLNVHLGVKKLMPEDDALALLKSKFIDCSYIESSRASFYLQKNWGKKDIPVIEVCEDLDDNFTRISGNVSYCIIYDGKSQIKCYSSAQEAIDAYMLLVNKK